MTYSHLHTLAAALAILLLIGFAVVATVISPRATHANPAGFKRAQTAPATTTINFMTPGAATTTLTLDTGEGNTFAPDAQTALLIQFNASSTLSRLAWRYEYSQDAVCGTTGSTADWYAADFPIVENATATTSPLGFSSAPSDAFWNFASTSPQAGIAQGRLAKKIILVPTPTRCVRVMFYVPIGAANASVWAEWVAKKQVP